MKARGVHGALSVRSGRWVRSSRFKLGLTLRSLGVALGISTMEVWRKERPRNDGNYRRLTVVQALAIRGMLVERVAVDAGLDVDKLIEALPKVVPKRGRG